MRFGKGRRRWLSMLFVAIMVSACGSGDGGGGQGEGETIKLGMLLAMTGEGSFYGKVMSQGAKLAAQEINDKGGVAGHELEILIEDHDNGNPDVAVSAARKFLDIEGTPAILSSYTAPTVAVQQLAVERGVLVLNGGGIGSDLIGKEGLYNTRMLGSQLVPTLMEWAVDEVDVENVATIFWNDAAGRAINDVVTDSCSELGCEVVAEEPHEIGATNYNSQLARIESESPDLVVLGSYGNDVGYIVSQARRQGIDAPIVGNEWTPDAQEIGGKAMEGYVAVIDQFDAESGDEQAEAFAATYKKEYGEEPEFYGANYYDLVRYVIPQLISQVAEDGGNPAEPGALLEAMQEAVEQGTAFETVYGDEMVFHEDGTIEKPAGLFEVKGGTLQRFAQVIEGRITE